MRFGLSKRQHDESGRRQGQLKRASPRVNVLHYTLTNNRRLVTVKTSSSLRGGEPSLNLPLHILGQFLLILEDVSLPHLNLLVLAQPNLLSHLADQPEIVRHQHHASRELVDRVRQRVDRLHVKMVGWLIKEEDVRIALGDIGEDEARLLSVRHVLDLRCLHLTGDSEPPDATSPCLELQVLLRELRVHVLQRRHVLVQLIHRVLMELGDLKMRMFLHVSPGGAQLPVHQLQQRTLSCSVGTDESDARVEIHRELQVLVEHVLFFATVRKGDIVDREDGRRDRSAVREMKLDAAIILRFLGESSLHHLVNNLLLRLSLLHQIGICTTGCDEFFQVLDVRLLLLIALHLIDIILPLCLDKRIVVSSVVDELSLRRQVNDVGANSIQEIFRVRDKNKNSRILCQVALQPAAGLHIQMVRGLVQEKKHRLQ
mmetsp:Transcript_6945/g.24298  ORF Transcript_6945/g.24298 Transcript_6945/m.24298 type:complete len:428 (-) Transcript_6945:805-2088(-)